jgi:hypothetical protein
MKVQVVISQDGKILFSGEVSYVKKNVPSEKIPKKVAKSARGFLLQQIFLEDPVSRKRENIGRFLLMEEDKELFQKISSSGKILTLWFGGEDNPFLQEFFIPVENGTKFHIVKVWKGE